MTLSRIVSRGAHYCATALLPPSPGAPPNTTSHATRGQKVVFFAAFIRWIGGSVGARFRVAGMSTGFAEPRFRLFVLTVAQNRHCTHTVGGLFIHQRPPGQRVLA